MISIAFRIILILGSLCTATFIVKKIRQSKLQIEYSVFWLVFSGILIVLSIFPEIAIYGAKLMGIYAPTNFIFLMVFFLLILKVFLMTIEISNLEYRIKELAQKIAITERIETDEIKRTEKKEEELE